MLKQLKRIIKAEVNQYIILVVLLRIKENFGEIWLPKIEFIKERQIS